MGEWCLQTSNHEKFLKLSFFYYAFDITSFLAHFKWCHDWRFVKNNNAIYLYYNWHLKDVQRVFITTVFKSMLMKQHFLSWMHVSMRVILKLCYCSQLWCYHWHQLVVSFDWNAIHFIISPFVKTCNTLWATSYYYMHIKLMSWVQQMLLKWCYSRCYMLLDWWIHYLKIRIVWMKQFNENSLIPYFKQCFKSHTILILWFW